MADAWNWCDLLELLVDHILQLGHILVKQDCQVCLLSRVLPGLNPACYIGIPSQIPRVDVEDSCSADCCRSGSLQVGNLKQELHLRSESNSLIAGQGQNLVVIHDSVEGLDPHGINVPIQNNPLWTISREVCCVPHDVGEESILPLSCGWIDDAIQLIIGDCLGVEVCVHWLLLLVLISFDQSLPHLCFASSCLSNYEDRMSHTK